MPIQLKITLYSYFAANTIKAVYFAVFPMNVSSLEYNFADFELLHHHNALPKCLRGILFLRKEFIREICEINPMRNLKLSQHPNCLSPKITHSMPHKPQLHIPLLTQHILLPSVLTPPR